MFHREGAARATFSQDGRWILTVGASPDHGTNGDSAYLWDASTGMLAAPPFKHGAAIRSAALSPDGQQLVIGGADGTARVWNCSGYSGEVEDLKAMVEVFSGRRMVGARILELLDPATVKRTFDQLKQKTPHTFVRSTNDILAWHRREAEARARFGRLFAARWRLDRVKVLTGDTEEYQRWLRHVLERGYPARHPATPTQLLDLTGLYTAPLTGRRIWNVKNGWVLHNIASLLGRQNLANVEFDVRGIVHLNGKRAVIPGVEYPNRVRLVGSQGELRRLHFLQATTGATSAGVKVGHYLVRYTNGQRAEIPLLYGINISEFHTPAVNLEQAKLAWSNQTSDLPENINSALFIFTWENPNPNQPISSIDFVSALTESAPFLVALTME
jgi:hypothetical protein